LWDFAIVIIPFAVWSCTVMNVHISDYEEAHICLGCLAMGCVAGICPILRVLIGGRVNQTALSLGLLAALCVFAALLGLFWY
jgi:hypothetical protein